VDSLRIEAGTAHVWFAYDIGQQIDLDRAQPRCSAHAERELIKHEHGEPAYLQFRPAPLHVVEPCAAIEVGGFATDGRVEATLYDFGAVSIAYRIPLGGHELDELRELASVLDENPLLQHDSVQRVKAWIDRLGDAVRAPRLADLVEDYAVFHLQRWSPADEPSAIVDARRDLVARTLRAERDSLRESEVADALQFRIAYGPRDDLVIDWNGAFLFDARGEDALSVLEFANVELLEMRYLDDRLDEALDRSYDVLRARNGRRSYWRLRRSDLRENLRRIAHLQLDNALLFESVNNAIKMLGDQFLARVYRLAARRLHLDDWDASILRKLETLDSIYGKLSDEQSTKRMELLEWIIILLFLVSILLPLLTPIFPALRGAGH
jgi:hypothetical protein